MDSEIMAQWGSYKVHRYNKKPGTPIELLVLADLQYIGRAWTIDDLEEATVINCETLRLSIHKCIEFGSTTLYDKYGIVPMTFEQLSDCAQDFMISVVVYFIGSTDDTHIVMDKCPYRLRQLHLGYKLSHTART